MLITWRTYLLVNVTKKPPRIGLLINLFVEHAGLIIENAYFNVADRNSVKASTKESQITKSTCVNLEIRGWGSAPPPRPDILKLYKCTL